MKNSRTIYSIMFTGKMILFAFLVSACGGYYSNLPADGIYATRTIEINHSETPRQNKSNYYKNYFNNLSQQESLPHSSDPTVHQDSIITDIEGYSQYDESYPETHTYQSNAPWGKNSSTTKIIIRDYSYPVYFGYGLFQRPWRLGFRPFGHRYYGHFYDPYYDAGFYGSYYGYGRFYDPYTYNPYYGHGGFYSPYSYPPDYGYGGYWVPRRFRYWDTYSYGDWDNSPGYNRFYRKEGYSGVSFSRGRRGEGGVTNGRTNSKSRKEIKEPNNRSSVKNDLSTRIIMARLQAGRNSSGIYNGTTDPQLTRSYSSGSSQVRSTSKVPAGVKSSSRSSSGKISSTRQGRTKGNQRKISPRTPDYQLSRQSGSSSINSKSKVENPRYKVQSSHSSSGRNSSSSSNTRPSSNNQYRKSASGVTNRNQSTGYSNSSNRYSTPSRTTQVQKSTYRSPSQTTSSRSSNKTVSKSSQTYQNKTSQKSYQPRNSSYNSSRSSSSQVRSQPTRSSYSSSRSSSSNSRGRSSSSGRRN